MAQTDRTDVIKYRQKLHLLYYARISEFHSSRGGILMMLLRRSVLSLGRIYSLSEFMSRKGVLELGGKERLIEEHLEQIK
jgi:hypothetical protein